MLKWLRNLFKSSQIPISDKERELRLVYKGFHETISPEAADAAERLVEVCNHRSTQEIGDDHKRLFDYTCDSDPTLSGTGPMGVWLPAADWASCLSGSPRRAYFCRNCGHEIVYQAQYNWYTCTSCGSTMKYEDICG